MEPAYRDDQALPRLEALVGDMAMTLR